MTWHVRISSLTHYDVTVARCDEMALPEVSRDDVARTDLVSYPLRCNCRTALPELRHAQRRVLRRLARAMLLKGARERGGGGGEAACASGVQRGVGVRGSNWRGGVDTPRGCVVTPRG